jgi:hypothetical protein
VTFKNEDAETFIPGFYSELYIDGEELLDVYCFDYV